MRMMNHNPELRPGYEEIIRNLNAVLHNSIDTSTLIMHKELPLPKGQNGSKSPNSTSSLRVKSPSVQLKRRRSSIAKNPLPDAEETSIKDLGAAIRNSADPDQEQKPDLPAEKKHWLPALVALTVIAAGFMIFAIILLIQSANFIPETVISLIPKG